MFISESESWSDFEEIFHTHRVSAQSTVDFLQKFLPDTFDGHLECLRKTQKCIYLRNGESESNFDEIFDLQGMCTVYWQIFAKSFSCHFWWPS